MVYSELYYSSLANNKFYTEQDKQNRCGERTRLASWYYSFVILSQNNKGTDSWRFEIFQFNKL